MKSNELKELFIEELKNDFSPENRKKKFIQGYIYVLQLNETNPTVFRKSNSRKIMPINANAYLKHSITKDFSLASAYIEFKPINRNGMESKKTYSTEYDRNKIQFFTTKEDLLEAYKVDMQKALELLKKERQKIDLLTKEIVGFIEKNKSY